MATLFNHLCSFTKQDEVTFHVEKCGVYQHKMFSVHSWQEKGPPHVFFATQEWRHPQLSTVLSIKPKQFPLLRNHLWQWHGSCQENASSYPSSLGTSTAFKAPTSAFPIGFFKISEAANAIFISTSKLLHNCLQHTEKLLPSSFAPELREKKKKKL